MNELHKENEAKNIETRFLKKLQQEGENLKIPESYTNFAKHWYSLNHFLGENEYFPKESRITRYIQDRLNYISDGKGGEVVVISDESPKGFAFPGHIIVSVGFLRYLETQEELDAFLAHEYTHIENRNFGVNILESISEKVGRRRGEETIADLRAFQLLDQKGINPLGIFTLLDKINKIMSMEAERSKKDTSSEIPEDLKLKWPHLNVEELDIEHGRPIDRKLNLMQIVRIADIRNLSLQKTPIAITEKDFEEHQEDENLWQNFYKLDRLSKRHFLERQFSKTEISTDIARFEQLVEWQKQLIIEEAPSLSEEEVNLALFQILAIGYGLDSMPYLDTNKNEVEQIEIFDLIKGSVKDIDSILKFLSLTKHPLFYNLGINLYPRSVDEATENLLIHLLNLKEEVDFKEYRSWVEKIIQFYQNDPSFSFLFLEPMEKYLLNKGAFNKEVVQRFVYSLIDAPVPTEDLVEMLTDSILKRYQANKETYDKLEEYNERQAKYEMAKSLEIAKKRLDILRKIEDPLDQLELLIRFFSVYDQYTIEVVSTFLKNFIKDHPINQIIGRLQRCPQTDRETFPGSPLGHLISDLYSWGEVSFKTYYLYGLLPAYQEEEREFEHDLKQNDLPERLLLWAICLSKHEYIEKVREDLERVDLKALRLSDLLKIAESIKEAPLQAKKLGFGVNFELSREDFKYFDLFIQKLRSKYLEEALRYKNPRYLVEAIKNFPIYNIEPESGELTIENWRQVANLIIDKVDPEKGPNLEELEEILALACFSNDTQISIQIASAATKELVDLLSFEGGVELVFRTYKHLPRHIFSEAIDLLIEEKARTPEDFEILEKEVKKELDRFLEDYEFIGKLTLADSFLELYLTFPAEHVVYEDVRGKYSVKGALPGQLLDALLKTSDSDKDFKEYLFDRWWLLERSSLDEKSKYFKVENFIYNAHSPNRLSFWLNDIPKPFSYTPLERVVKDAYQSDENIKYFILRKLLVGSGGVLVTEEGRKNLIKNFLSSWVDFPNNSESEPYVTQLTESLMKIGAEDEIYQLIAPVLKDFVLRPPRKSYPFENIAIEAAKKIVAENYSREDLETKDYYSSLMATKIFYLIVGRAQLPQEATSVQETLKNDIFSLFERKEESSPQKLTPLKLAIAVGKISGAPGVKMLQLAGQYFDIPEEERDNLLEVYDSIKGQSRLQAYRTLKREAENSDEIAKLLEEIKTILPRTGGGSLLTVYEVIKRNGGREVIKIRNPNIEYNLEQWFNLTERTLRHAMEEKPEDLNYQLLDSLIDDVRKWIINELNDPTFEEKDKKFRLQNDSRFGNFNPGKNKYQIVVPQSFPTNTRWIRREEFIDGANLTSLVVIDGETDISLNLINKNDYQNVVALLAKNYLYQLTETGLVHSDIHPGNFRISIDNQSVAILDRNNLIELDESEKEFIKQMIFCLALGRSDILRDKLLDFLLSLEENRSFENERENILKQLENSSSDDIKTKELFLLKILLTLKRCDVKIPLKLSLIAKNLLHLNKLAREAGFSNLGEAITFGI